MHIINRITVFIHYTLKPKTVFVFAYVLNLAAIGDIVKKFMFTERLFACEGTHQTGSLQKNNSP